MNIVRQYKGQLILTVLLCAALLLAPFSSSLDYTLEEPCSTISAKTHYLRKGSYAVTVTAPEGTLVRILDPTHLNTDNTAGLVLAEGTLPKSVSTDADTANDVISADADTANGMISADTDDPAVNEISADADTDNGVISADADSFDTGADSANTDSSRMDADSAAGQVVPVTASLALSFTVDDFMQAVQVQFDLPEETDSENAAVSDAAEATAADNTDETLCRIELHSEQGLYHDGIFFAAFALLCSLIGFILRRRGTKWYTLALLCGAALFASLPIFTEDLLYGHDIYFHYTRLVQLASDLAEGQFPVRLHIHWFLDYGYQSSIFYPELFLYPFAALIAVGLSPVSAYHLLILCINLAAAGISLYAFPRLLGSRKLGVAAALLYTLSQYRLINLYTRAALGEVIASIFLPLLLLGMHDLILGDSRHWRRAVIAFTGLLQSHIITTFLSVLASGVFALLHLPRLKDEKRLPRILLAAGMTVLLNLGFLLPMVTHMGYAMRAFDEVNDLERQAVYASQLFDITFGYTSGDALNTGRVHGEMSFSLGIVLLFGCLLFLYYLYQHSKKSPLKSASAEARLQSADENPETVPELSGLNRSFPGLRCLLAGLFCAYASSTFFPWGLVQKSALLSALLGNIQFAFRFLPLATLFLCIPAAIGICEVFQGKQARLLTALACALVLFVSDGLYLRSFIRQSVVRITWNEQLDEADSDIDLLYLVNREGSRISDDELRGLYRSPSFTASDNVTLSETFRGQGMAGFSYSCRTDSINNTAVSNLSYVDLSLHYYPDYRAYDAEGSELQTSVNDRLCLRVWLPEGSTSGSVTVAYTSPQWYTIADLISLTSALGLCLTKKHS